MIYAILLALSYLLGSIPFGLLIGKWFAKIDVRQHGSGNIGMTNVLRTAGYLPALFTLIGDAGKGVFAVLLTRHFTGDSSFALIAGTLTVIGHNWSIFLRFKGGKGVATIAGVLFAFLPWAAGLLLIIWLGVLLRYRYISLASIVVAFCIPFVLLFFQVGWLELLLGIIVGAFTIFRHRSNIERLRKGTEFRFGQKV